MAPLIIEPKTNADSSVIWLHGLGANKYDFESIAKLLQANVLPSTRFILPQAPTQPVTLNSGMSMPSWYDIVSLTFPHEINIAELEASSQMVVDLIENERKKGIPLNRIVLAGFSQGGAVALHSAYIYYPENVAGVMALSTYAPTFSAENPLPASKIEIPSAHFHGRNDNVVNPQFGKEAFEFLQQSGINAKWHDYAMRHEVNEPELNDIANWLDALLNP